MRLELGGYEGRIPNIALPDPNLSADLPIQSLVLVDNTPFEKADWVALGYTHYEVWCVGAAGGMGGEAGAGYIHSMNTPEQVRMPDWMWEGEIQEQANQWISQGQTVFPVYEFSTVPGHTGEVVVRYITAYEAATQQAERYNPDHLTTVNHFHDPFVISAENPTVGGGGGGGGLHVMGGALSDLPDFVPVTVGVAGDDALPGQVRSSDPYDPFAATLSNLTVASFGTAGQFGYDRYVYTNQYPPVEERTLLLPPQSGEDGGYSAFGDICMASGGKGGGPALVWVDGNRFFAAHGGEGGSGGRIEAGGGALGSTSSLSGKDGTWDGEIGTGGGGGRGGMAEVKPNEMTIPRIAMGW